MATAGKVSEAIGHMIRVGSGQAGSRSPLMTAVIHSPAHEHTHVHTLTTRYNNAVKKAHIELIVVEGELPL